MRGHEKKQSSMLCLISPSDRVPKNHPLREMKRLTDDILKRLSRSLDRMYSERGRPSIPPETLLKASLLMALYTIRSERQFCEQLEYNLLFRWFLDMDMIEPSFDASVFSKNRERLLAHDIAGKFFRRVLDVAREENLMSSEHFTVDGTLIDAWASLKSFKAKDSDDSDDSSPDDPSNPTVNFHGETRRNETHESTTDPEAKLMRKGSGKEAKLSYAAHALMENRNGLLADVRISEANGRAEREVALEMIRKAKLKPGSTIGADKAYDTKDFVRELRQLNCVPHIASKSRYSNIDRRTTRHARYLISQRARKRVEEIFGWSKTIGGFRKTRYKGRSRNQLAVYLVGAAYNLLRIAKITMQPA